MAKIKTLRDIDGEIVYPQTSAKAVAIKEDLSLDGFYQQTVRADSDIPVEEVQTQNLPIASTTTLGAVKIGNNIKVAPDGTISATPGITEEVDPSVPDYVKAITQEDIGNWDRKTTLITRTGTLFVGDWETNTQTVSVEGVTPNHIVFVCPSVESQELYLKAGIICIEQLENGLVFSCKKLPEVDLNVNIVVDGVESYAGTIDPMAYSVALNTTEQILGE